MNNENETVSGEKLPVAKWLDWDPAAWLVPAQPGGKSFYARTSDRLNRFRTNLLSGNMMRNAGKIIRSQK
jgi:hypothetical protein